MIVAAFLIINQANWVKFFKKGFLVANNHLEVVFEIFIFTLSNVDIDFLNQKHCWKTYITKKVFLITRPLRKYFP